MAHLANAVIPTAIAAFIHPAVNMVGWRSKSTAFFPAHAEHSGAFCGATPGAAAGRMRREKEKVRWVAYRKVRER